MKNNEEITFGQLISRARIREGINLTECAAFILKDDGSAISVQYLSDLEKDRRNPPSEPLLKQFSTTLNIPIEVLYFYSETFPSGISKKVTEEQIVAAFRAFFEKLGQNPTVS
jgi:transcriptional regulator with XRE-family HTH domain